jgi:hypothetical protein
MNRCPCQTCRWTQGALGIKHENPGGKLTAKDEGSLDLVAEMTKGILCPGGNGDVGAVLVMEGHRKGNGGDEVHPFLSIYIPVDLDPIPELGKGYLHLRAELDIQGNLSSRWNKGHPGQAGWRYKVTAGGDIQMKVGAIRGRAGGAISARVVLLAVTGSEPPQENESEKKISRTSFHKRKKGTGFHPGKERSSGSMTKSHSARTRVNLRAPLVSSR